jgi:DNA-directed RNA polymerase specialized sigma subunit
MFRTEIQIQEVATLLRANRSQTVDEIAAAAGISHSTCHKILSELNMSRVTQHSFPSVLTQEQRDDHMNICGDLIKSADKDGTFSTGS